MVVAKERAYQRGERITKQEAIQLLAIRDSRKNDGDRSAKDRAKDTIKRAVKSGQLSLRDGGKRFLIEDFVGWARVRPWKGKLKHSFPFPQFPAQETRTHSTGVVYEGFHAGTFLRHRLEPDLPHAIQEWSKWEAETMILRAENQRLRAEIDRLKPLAEKWENFCKVNRINGGQRDKK
jgi:hypothetical protein